MYNIYITKQDVKTMDVHYIDWGHAIHNGEGSVEDNQNQHTNMVCPICGFKQIRAFKLIGFKCEESVFQCMNNDCKYTW